MSQASFVAWYNIFQHARDILGCGAACPIGILGKRESVMETIQPYRRLAAGPLQRRRSPFVSEIVDAGDYLARAARDRSTIEPSQAHALPNMNPRAFLVGHGHGSSRCGGALSKNAASTLVCDKSDQPRAKKNGSGKPEPSPGRNHASRVKAARSREVRDSPELRVRRAECRRCGYSPPRRPSAGGRGWPQTGQRTCWGSRGRS